MSNSKPKKFRFDWVACCHLDFFRGITMFLLVAEGTALWSVLVREPVAGSFLEPFFQQFHHHSLGRAPFLGFSPAVFYVHCRCGNAFFLCQMAKKRTRQKITRHIIRRCILPFAFGVGLFAATAKTGVGAVECAGATFGNNIIGFLF